MACYINRSYRCDCPEAAYGGGRTRYRGRCTDAKGAEVDIQGAGGYGPDTVHVQASVRLSLGGLPLEGEARLEGRRLSAA